MSKQLAEDRLTPAVLGPVMRLVRLAADGHQGVPQALVLVREEFLHRVELRGDRRGGLRAAAKQWDRSVAGAVAQVGHPRWLSTENPAFCECWIEGLLASYRAAAPPEVSKGRARTSDSLVLEHLAWNARSTRRRVVWQSQRQISEATTIRLETVNRAIARLVKQGWLERQGRNEFGTLGLELALPMCISGTSKDPLARGHLDVPVLHRELHPIFGSGGVGPGVAETYRHLPELRMKLIRRKGTLRRVTPGTPAGFLARQPSRRMPPPPRGSGRTVADLVQVTGRHPSTVRGHLKKLGQLGLAFRDDRNRWWRYLTDPDWIARRAHIEDPTPERRAVWERQRRARHELFTAQGYVRRVDTDGVVIYADAESGQVLWQDNHPVTPREPLDDSDATT
ncbi:hypothetical protein [Ornithinimicrobium cryptoxanthini]|uniref:Uncharacterized protein n=1 Tax=Ornithinimicrobium cryptoxanthini TaxID=2934161 RepID=A0ABY4YGT5_9MICO|nr:hypothetical protein [Ornithinimicrobium cryptoxanthini]USQ75357.1 hypothetical protein NF557_12085 [Ornithinimicrobium cryptoxanthini]